MAKNIKHGGRSRATARAFFVVSLLLFVGPVSRSQESLVFRHLTVSQGLSQGSVVCMLQDRQGFMWFGTQDGLNRFDGYGFTVFKHSPSDPASLNDNFVITIAEDSSGRLWVGTLNSPDTLNLFDPLTESFSQVPKDSVDLWRAHVGSAFLVYEDPSGVRWSGSRGGGSDTGRYANRQNHRLQT